jgi:TatA/E family protein of Tat protein translocase
MVIIFIVALVVFGPEKLPDLAKTAAKGLREFRRATEDLKTSWHEHMREAENPVNEIRQTFQEAKTDIEDASAKLLEEEPPAPAATGEESMPESAPEPVPESAPESTPEMTPETKPDAH